uniref:Phorbol-ester/DAG-type domain-containing protein n=1 Tax=Parascaris univalens TaxID=6257 RepID=A0A915C699_PARUN
VQIASTWKMPNFGSYLLKQRSLQISAMPVSSPTVVELKTILNKYDEIHRRLVQYTMKEGYTTTEEFLEKFILLIERYGCFDEHQMQNLRKITKKEKRDILANLMRVLNGQLDHLGLRIVEVFDEHQGGVAYVTLITTCTFNDMYEKMSGLSNAEVALFNVWLGMMCTSVDGQILLIDALDAAVKLPRKISQKRAQKLIDRLIAEHWLTMAQDNEALHLSVHAMAQMQADLMSRFSLKMCVHCKNAVVIIGHALHCDACNAYIHRHCAQRLRDNMRSGILKCPGREGRCETILDE